jgi:hypothetical protein
MIDQLKHELRIKYGLSEYPSDGQISDWLSRTEALVADGADAEEAGRAAAFEAFGELDAVLLFSEADTIQALLAKARAK